MSLEENKAVVRRLYEAMNRREWDSLDDLLAPGYVHHSTSDHDLTQEELKQFMTATASAFPDLQVSLDELIAEEEKVMARWTQSATHTSEFMGIPPTGKRITWSGIISSGSSTAGSSRTLPTGISRSSCASYRTFNDPQRPSK